MQAPSFEETVEQIVAKDPRYHREAYLFVREALDHTQKMIGKAPKKEEIRHVTGQQLLDGIRDYALQQFGPMALTVLEAWDVRRCEDFGEIVFNMVETKVLAKTETDDRDDFKSGYDFHEVFRKPFLPGSRTNAPQPEASQS
jgi:uncharacterized repeat protein (TIGR04138 family)